MLTKIRFAPLLLILCLLVPFSPLAAQTGDDFAPRQGPPGTTVAVICASEGSAFIYYSNHTSESTSVPLNAQGLGSFTVYQDAFFGETIRVSCPQPGVEFPPSIGSFTVTECGLANEARFDAIAPVPLTRSHYRSSFTGEDLGIDRGGLFAHTIDVTNSAGQTLRLTFHSADPSLLVDYMSGLRVDFTVTPVAGGNTTGSRECNNDAGFLSVAPDTATTIGDIDVEIILLAGGSVGRGEYVVSYEIDPDLRANQIHTYRPLQAVSASANVTASQGRVKLTMWNSEGYVNAIVHSPTLPKLPSLVNSVAPDEAEYYAAVLGMDSNNRYTIRGSFGTTPCAASSQECGAVVQPQLRLLQGGIGMSDGSPMNDGNFQVEGYCDQGYIQGYTAISHDNYNWYCHRSRNSPDKVILTQYDFTRICQITYNAPNAVAISDRGESIPAFNWRCLGR